ncbi:unnamed protein product [Closterium sp. NIES-53]
MGFIHFCFFTTIPEAERTRALATIQHSVAAETTAAAAEATETAAKTTSAAAETLATPTTLTTPVASSSTTSPYTDNTSPTPAQQLTPISREVHRSANFTTAFYSNSDLYRPDEAEWDEQNVDNASDEAGRLPYCSVPIPMDDENPRKSLNAETYFDLAETGYVTPAEVNTNEAECIGPNFIPDPETGDEAAYPEDTTLPRYTQSGLQILGLVTAWVFRVKTKADSTIDKFKARWVVRGFDQEHGRDFTETFAPVSRHTSLQILLAIAAMKKKKLRQIDVANAFLYAPVDTEIFVELLHGELQKDLTLTVSSTVTRYLGLNIQEGEDTIYLNAAKYADTIAKRFALTPTTISTPYRYTAGNDKTESALLKPAGIRNYQRKLGCLLFAAVTCRPDLSYSASQLATYLKRPEDEHMKELDRALHYLLRCPAFLRALHAHPAAHPPAARTRFAGPAKLLLLLSAVAAACPTRNRAALPSALPTRERASCLRAPVHPCSLALPASSMRPAVRCCCCHLRGPSCCMRCCCHLLLLLLSTTAAVERAAVATAAASVPAAAPELLLLLLLLQMVLLLRLSCCRYPRCLYAPSPRAAAAVRLLLCVAAAATCCSCCSLLLLLLAAADAPCCCCSLLLLLPTATAAATPLAAAGTATAAMANFSVLRFDAEGRAISFDVWLDDLRLYLQSEARDGISLFLHTEGALPAPAATVVEDHSKWLMRDATAHLTVRNHLPVAERVHFSQQKTAKALCDAVVACHSSLATAALGRLMLPYLHPELADFHTVPDLFTHLRSSEAR